MKINKALKEIYRFCQKTQKNYQSMKKNILKILALLAIIIAISACNVTRTMTTESQAYQRGDTSVHIVTKTTEVYNATKNMY